jgi:hypothetical protein
MLSTVFSTKRKNAMPRLIFALTAACVWCSNCLADEIAAQPQPVTLAPERQAWLDQYGGTWGLETQKTGRDKYYFSTYLIFAVDAQGALQIRGSLNNDKGQCRITPPAPFRPGGTQWRWYPNYLNKEVCTLNVKRAEDDLSVDFSGCRAACNSDITFSRLRLKRMSAQPMQAPRGIYVGLCISGNPLQRQLCLSPKLRQLADDLAPLQKQAIGAFEYGSPEYKAIPPPEDELVLQLADKCRDIACVEEAHGQVNRELSGQVNAVYAAQASSVKFAPLPSTLYRGQLGTQKAVACLGVNDEGELHGSYYDEKSFKTMVLHRNAPTATVPDPPVLDVLPEDEFDLFIRAQGIWRFNELSAAAIRGARSDKHDSSKAAMPFTMQEIATVADCDKALTASRQPDLRVLNRQNLGGIVFVTYGNKHSDEDQGSDVTGLRIESGLGEAARRKINAVLKKSFADARAQWFDCTSTESSQSVTALAKNYLTVRYDDSSECGGAHPFYGTKMQSFDLRTGDPLEPGKWVDSPAFAASAKNGPIRREVEQQLDDAPDAQGGCLAYFDQSWDGKSFWLSMGSFWLSKDGVVLTFSTSAPALLVCNGDYTIAFKTFRRVIHPEALPVYDQYVNDAKKGLRISQ